MRQRDAVRGSVCAECAFADDLPQLGRGEIARRFELIQHAGDDALCAADSAPMSRSSGNSRIAGANLVLYASTSVDHWPGSKLVGTLSGRSASCCGDAAGAGSVVTGARARALATRASSQATVRAACTSRALLALAWKFVPSDARQPVMKGVERPATSASSVAATRASSATASFLNFIFLLRRRPSQSEI